MKTIILGSQGMLGKYVNEYLLCRGIDVFGTTRETFDAYKLFTTGKLINELTTLMCIDEPFFVINCMGITNKRPDITPEEMYFVNGCFPHIVSRVFNERMENFIYAEESGFIHISTDCVFKGDKGEYTSESYTDSLEHYGISKSIGEQARRCYVLRTSIIGRDKNDRSLLEWVLNRENLSTVNGYTNHKWNGVTCLELAHVIEEIIIGDIKLSHGVTNVASQDYVIKAELVRLIAATFGKNIAVEEVKTEKSIDRTLNPLIVRKTIQEQLQALFIWHKHVKFM